MRHDYKNILLAIQANLTAGREDEAKRVIEKALSEAVRLGHGYVGTEHLLLGIISEPDCTGARAIAAAGVDARRIYSDIVSVFRGGGYSASHSGQRGSETNEETKTIEQFSRDLTRDALQGNMRNRP